MSKRIEVPFGAKFYTLQAGAYVNMWFKKSDGVILECKAPKTSPTPQYPFWEVSIYPSIKVLEDSFGSALRPIHELGECGKGWVEMKR